MNQRGTGEPRHERGVFNRIPEPPAAPAEFVIRPPAAKRDANCQKQPRPGRPRSCPARPGLVQVSAQHGRNGERKSHREADITDVKNRRVYCQPGILQQRIQVRAVKRRRNQPFKWIRGQQSKQQESTTQESQYADYPGPERLRQFLAVAADSYCPGRQNDDPQEQRAFMRAPDRRKFVNRRQCELRMICNVFDRKIAVQKGPAEAGESHYYEYELPECGRPCHCHQWLIVPVRAEQR